MECAQMGCLSQFFFHLKWKHNYSLVAGDVDAANVGGSN